MSNKPSREKNRVSITKSESSIGLHVGITKNELKNLIGVNTVEAAEEILKDSVLIERVTGNIDSSNLESALSLHSEVESGDIVERLLIAQIIQSYKVSNKLCELYFLPNQSPFGREQIFGRYNKAINNLTKLVDALTRYQKKGQQRVVVEHLSMDRGSQAIIGSVHKEGGGS